jgi:hypothetical protein
VYVRGIASWLAADGAATVASFDATAHDTRQRIEEFAPDVVAFEPESALSVLPISFVLERPDVLLVVLQPDSERMLILSGRHYEPATARDLVDTLVGMLPTSRAAG